MCERERVCLCELCVCKCVCLCECVCVNVCVSMCEFLSVCEV